MLRIDAHPLGSTRVDFRLSGRLADLEVQQLSATISPHVDGAKVVHLDLSGLTGLDRKGVSLLLHLASEGVRLAHCPPYLTQWLRAEGRSRNRDGSRIHEIPGRESTTKPT